MDQRNLHTALLNIAFLFFFSFCISCLGQVALNPTRKLIAVPTTSGGGGGSNTNLVSGPTNELATFVPLAWYVGADYKTNTGTNILIDRWTNHYDLTNVITGVATPSIVTESAPVLNGSNALAFPGATATTTSADLNQKLSPSNGQPFEVWMVYNYTNAWSTGSRKIWTGTNSSVGNAWGEHNGAFFRINATTLDFSVLDTSLTNHYVIYRYYLNGTSSTISTNGVDGKILSPGNNGLQGFSIGGDQGGGSPPAISYAEIVVWVNNLPGTNTTSNSNLCRYFGNKYNITNHFWP